MNDVVETLTEDNWRPVAVEPLSPLELQVKAHWERFQPTLVKALSTTPRGLETAVRKATHQWRFQVALAEAQTGMHRVELEHEMRDQLFLPPEPALER